MTKVYIFVLALLQCALQESFFRSEAAEPKGPSEPESQEMRQCGERMVRMHKAIFRFYREHKRLPDFLSDLWPKYLPEEDFTCPAIKRVGDQTWARAVLKKGAFRDPKFDSSTYSYEFIMKIWEGTSVTYQEYKNAQRDYFGLRFGEGDSIPLLRCFLHGKTNVLNVSFGGKLFKSGLEWEEKYDLAHEELGPEAVMPVSVRLEEPVPTRPSGLSAELVDLTQSYNALVGSDWTHGPDNRPSAFAGLLDDPRFLRNLKFDARGVIQLKGRQLYRPFPLMLQKIRVAHKAQRVRILLGTYGKAGMGEIIAQMRLNYADRTSTSFPVEYGSDVLDWSIDPAEEAGYPASEQVGWVGERQTGEGKAERVVLYEFTRVNPHAGKEIASIDFEVSVVDSVISKSAPAIFAITLEPPE